MVLGRRQPLDPDDFAARNEDRAAVALLLGHALGPEDLLEFFSAGRAERAIAVARPAVPDEERELEPRRIEETAGGIIRDPPFSPCSPNGNLFEEGSEGGRSDEPARVCPARFGDGQAAPSVPQAGITDGNGAAAAAADPVPPPFEDERFGNRQLAAVGHAANGLHVVERNVEQIAFQRPQEDPHDATGEGRRESFQHARVQKRYSGLFGDGPRRGGAGFFFQEIILVPAGGSQSSKGPAYGGREIFFQVGNEFPPDFVAQNPIVAVGVIRAPSQLPIAQIFEDFVASQSKQGPDDGSAADGGDSGQAGRPRPPQDTHQNRFGLVVHGVTGGDLRRPRLGGGPFKKFIAQPSPRVFDTDAQPSSGGPNVGAARIVGQVQGQGHVLDESLIGSRLRAETVIEMGDGQGKRDVPAKFQEKVQEGGGIGPAGTGRKNGFPGLDESARPDGGPDFAEGGMVSARSRHSGFILTQIGTA